MKAGAIVLVTELTIWPRAFTAPKEFWVGAAAIINNCMQPTQNRVSMNGKYLMIRERTIAHENRNIECHLEADRYPDHSIRASRRFREHIQDRESRKGNQERAEASDIHRPWSKPFHDPGKEDNLENRIESAPDSHDQANIAWTKAKTTQGDRGRVHEGQNGLMRLIQERKESMIGKCDQQWPSEKILERDFLFYWRQRRDFATRILGRVRTIFPWKIIG